MTEQRDDIARWMGPVAARLLGKPNISLSTRTEWRYGSKGSLSIDLVKGTWFSHETGEGGGVLDLICRELNCGVGFALRWMKREISADIPAFNDALDLKRTRSNFRDLAVDLWQRAVPAKGTLAERYLVSRKLSCPDWMRFSPRAPFRKDKDGRQQWHPCMIAPMRSILTGELTGVHRTALTADGRQIGKAMLGICDAACVHLDGDLQVGGALAVCEGIETGLALLELGCTTTLWALADAGRMRRMPLVDGIGRLLVFADNDEPNMPRYPYEGGEGVASARVLAERYREHGVEVEIRSPPRPGMDFADLLIEIAGAAA